MTARSIMSAPDARPPRSPWRFCLAILALAANMVLPSAMAQAAPPAVMFGELHAICLASGSEHSGLPVNGLPGEPAASAIHCSLCLFSPGFNAPVGTAQSVTVAVDYPVVLSYAYDEPARAPQLFAQKFDARAPPA
jgi:hypothetical protein